MPTLKKRLNITLPSEIDSFLTQIAKRDQIPQATKAAELIALALEIEEDINLDAIARMRDTKDAEYVSHDEAWAEPV
jgi:predicted DNA-binding protein